MRPTPSDLHISGPLTNVSVAYMQGTAGFVADRVFPIVSVDKQADQFPIYAPDSWNRSQMKLRAPATESAGAEYAISWDNFFCHVYALHRDIDEQTRAAADSQFNLDRDATEFLALQAMLHKEIAFATDFLTTSVWTSQWAGVSSNPSTNQFQQWDTSGSDPVADVLEAKQTVHGLTGIMPNKLVIGSVVWSKLLTNAALLDRIKYGQTAGAPAMVNKRAFAEMCELDEVLVMDGIQNTAKDGASATNAYIGGKKALLVHVPSRPGLLTPSAGYTFSWSGYTGAGANGSVVRRFYLDAIRADRVELEIAYAQKKVAADLGLYMYDVIA